MKKVCAKCLWDIYDSEIKWYKYECNNCDESLYSFETKRIAETPEDEQQLKTERKIDSIMYDITRELAQERINPEDYRTKHELEEKIEWIISEFEWELRDDDSYDFEAWYLEGFRTALQWVYIHNLYK